MNSINSNFITNFPKDQALPTTKTHPSELKGTMSAHDIGIYERYRNLSDKTFHLATSVMNSTKDQLTTFLEQKKDPISQDRIKFPSECIEKLRNTINTINSLISMGRKSIPIEVRGDLELLAETKNMATSLLDRIEVAANKIAAGDVDQTANTQSLASNLLKQIESNVPRDISSMNTFKNLLEFSKLNDIRGLKYTEADLHEATKEIGNTTNFAEGTGLSKVENNLITFYTQAGYYDMNSVLDGNLSSVVVNALKEMELVNINDIARLEDNNSIKDQIEYPTYRHPPKVKIDGEKVLVTIHKDFKKPDKGEITFELNQDTKNTMFNRMKQALVLSCKLCTTLDKLPVVANDYLVRSKRHNESILSRVMAKYNPLNLEIPFDKMLDLSDKNIIVKENRFTSASTELEVVKEKFDYGVGTSVEYRIAASNGRDIMAFSDATDEREVLLLPGAELKILGLMKQKKIDDGGIERELIIISCRQVDLPPQI